MDADLQKEEKEAFVSGLSGTTLLEVNVIVHYSIILCGFRALVIAILPSSILQAKWTRFLLEFFTLILPMIAMTTIFADESTLVFMTTLTVVIFGILMLPSKKNNGQQDSRNNGKTTSYAVTLKRSAAEELLNADWDFSEDDSDILSQNADEDETFLSGSIISPNRVPGITLFRSWTTVISCICILAVDFDVFPRRLAKTEVFGTGLMDTGVGLFIIANGIVSPEARGQGKHHTTFCKKLGHVKLAVISSWPLWGIGLGRALIVKMIGYQEHVSEYGVHWNFFFTLAAVRIFSAFVLSFFSISLTIVLSVICILAYQFVLLHPSYNLSSIILNDNREGFFMANKEGICSCAGYLSLYLASVYLGAFLFKGGRVTVRSWITVFIKFAVTTAILCLVTILTDAYLQPISRRFANLAFVAWILAMSCTIMAGVFLLDFFLIFCAHRKKLPMDTVPEQIMLKGVKKSKENDIKYTPPPPPLCLLTAVNRNQFVYFLVSNVSTGLVNIIFDTLSMSDTQAMLIVSFYMFCNLLFIWILHMKQISLKFW